MRIRLSMQGTWVGFLVREGPKCRRATKPMSHEPRAHVLQQESSPQTAMKTQQSQKQINKILKYVYKVKDSEKVLDLINLEAIT